VGFWVVARGIDAAAELPASVPVRVSGEPAHDRRALVLAAADEAGAVRWGVIVHDDGASVLLPSRGRLLAGLGRRLVLIDEAGAFTAERAFATELLGAWALEDGYLLLGRGVAWRVDGALGVQWERGLAGETFHVLDAGPAGIRLVAMDGADWREHVIDPATGRDFEG
jgi:hypothetical protein